MCCVHDPGLDVQFQGHRHVSQLDSEALLPYGLTNYNITHRAHCDKMICSIYVRRLCDLTLKSIIMRYDAFKIAYI